MDEATRVIGYLLTLAACIGVYLSSPQQSWLSRPIPSWPARVFAVLLMGAGLGGLLQTLQPLSAIFSQLMLVITLFAAFPYLGALRRLYNEKPLK